MFDRRLIQNFDWGLLGITFFLGVVGSLTLFSAVTAETPHPQKYISLRDDNRNEIALINDLDDLDSLELLAKEVLPQFS